MKTADNIVSIHNILQQYIPPASVEYAYSLWTQKPFLLKITKSRQTKVGDFSCRHNSAEIQITINQDLNPYLFLLTYIHEVAHLRVFISVGKNAEPHGQEWKNCFRDLLTPILTEAVFPLPLLNELQRHIINPKASSFADITLTQALRAHDKNAQSAIYLSAIPQGSIFKLQGKYFKKGQLKRTRVVCFDMKSKRNYLVPIDVPVTDVQISLF